jgi:N-acetylneuraminic acid mutarotase
MTAPLLALAFSVNPLGGAAAQRIPTLSPLRSGLTMEQRVNYQRAIEEVYWRHRVWPGSNTKPKPSLEQALPASAVAAKVRAYLNNSRALEAAWHRPMTEELLHAEMVRMATRTKSPEMLRELWAALGNDPYVIAECLARQALSDRFWAARDPFRTDRDSFRAARDPFRADTAAARMADGPAARFGHTAVWTGSEMIIWGGADRGMLNTGARYDPATDTWTPISTIGAPTARSDHSAVWTGREMIVWGGVTDPSTVGTGGRYDPASDTWNAISTDGAPTSRRDHTAVWTGAEMIIWGGVDPTGTDVTYQSGGRYNPETDNWTDTSVAGAPSQRAMHTAVWTGQEMIVWGGIDLWTYLLSQDAGRYNPTTDTWTSTSAVNAPSPRVQHTAVWTGSTMVVWGGGDTAGGIYDPRTDTWAATSTDAAPTARYSSTVVWTGSVMIVWGGYNWDGSTITVLGSGGRYDPAMDAWTPVDDQQAPGGRYLHTAVWTAAEMIVWGGYDGVVARNDGGRYDPLGGGWVPTAVGQESAAVGYADGCW